MISKVESIGGARRQGHGEQHCSALPPGQADDVSAGRHVEKHCPKRFADVRRYSLDDFIQLRFSCSVAR